MPAKLALEFLKSIEPPAKKPTDVEVSSGGDSDEDIPSKSAPSKAASKSPDESEDEAPARQVISESESKDEQEEDDEIASNPSSTRDSRSPVVFSQHEGGAEAAKSNRSASPDSASDSEDEHQSETESVDSEDSAASDKIQHNADESEDEASDAEDAEVQVPDCSPTLPRHKPTAKPSGPTFDQVNSKNHTIEERDTSTSTQGEIDQQLTSSMYEVRRSPPKPVPSSRPSLKIGASLQALNSRKAAPSSTSTMRNVPQQQTLKEASGSEDESEEESNEDSSDEDSEDDEATAKRLASARSRSSQQKNKPKPEPADSDSESNDSGSSTDSDSDAEEEEDAKTQMRNDLAAQIASMGGLDSQKSEVSVASPKVVRDSQPKEKEKKRDRWISGQKFSQPGL